MKTAETYDKDAAVLHDSMRVVHITSNTRPPVPSHASDSNLARLTIHDFANHHVSTARVWTFVSFAPKWKQPLMGACPRPILINFGVHSGDHTGTASKVGSARIPGSHRKVWGLYETWRSLSFEYYLDR